MTKDEDHVTSVLTFFYPEDPPRRINGPLRECAAAMLAGALKMSKMIDLLPRAPGVRPGVGWLLSEAIKVFWRSARRQKIYEIARQAIRIKYKSVYRLCQSGVEFPGTID